MSSNVKNNTYNKSSKSQPLTVKVLWQLDDT